MTFCDRNDYFCKPTEEGSLDVDSGYNVLLNDFIIVITIGRTTKMMAQNQWKHINTFKTN